MELTSHETWAVVHGMLLGALYLLMFGGALAGLWSFRPVLLTTGGVVVVVAVATLIVAARLRATHAAAAASRLSDEIHDRLLAHAAKEEAGILTALRAEGVDPLYLARFECDHGEILQLLEDAATSPAWPAAARSLAGALQVHIEREEY